MVRTLASALFVAILLVSCSPAPKEPRTLSLGLMPAVDAAPILMAEKEGYFKDEGIDVTLTVFTNAMERQASLQSGALDGAMTDLVAFALNVSSGFDLRVATLTDGSFPFVSRPGFADGGTLKVAMMEASVSNFLADAWLAPTRSLEKVFVNDIPARLELVKKGMVDLACLPEPVASMGELAGLGKLAFDNPDGEVPDVFVFTGKSAAEKKPAVEAFLKAYDKGVEAANAQPEAVRKLLVLRLNLDPRVGPLMDLPRYRPSRLPAPEYLAKIGVWTEKLKGEPLLHGWTERTIERTGTKNP